MQRIQVATREPETWVDITREVEAALTGDDPFTGAVLVYSPHTTAGITVNEDWDPAVVHDALDILGELVPRRRARWTHGEGNSAAHVKTALVGSSVLVPVEAGRLVLGRWQGIFLAEFDGPRDREVWITPLGR